MSRSERSDEVRSYVKSNWQLYAMLLIPVAFVLIFKYAAYPGLRIAFMNYKPAKGYAGSAWVGAENFQKDFQYQLAIYIYEKGLAGGNFSRATAVGLFHSLVGLILVLAADRVTKALGEDGLL